MSHLFKGAEHAALYSKFRPSPPGEFIKEIIAFLKHKVKPLFQQALDIGCGSGQSTTVLAPHFQSVFGVDVSEAQIQNAKENRSAHNIEYRVSTGDDLFCKSSTVDLITISQALHWFDTEKLFSEVNRVLKPNAVFAAYGYWIPLPKVADEYKTEKLRKLIENDFYHEALNKFWDTRRSIIEKRYADINLPLDDCVRSHLIRETKSTLQDYFGYLSSWSAYQKLYKENSEKAVELINDTKKQFTNILGAEMPEEEITVTLLTEYFMLMGRKPDSK